jgi:aldose 1-epimerase
VPSDHYVEVDSMLLPTERTPSVEESVYDFRTPAALNSAELDIAIHKTANPLLLSNAMYTLELSSSEAFSYWQLFTPPGRRSIAVEPITAATDAFNRPSLGLKKLEPGDSYSGSIAVRMLR